METYSVANEFDSEHSSLGLTELPKEHLWETISLLARRWGPKLILGLFPAFLQIEFAFHRAVRTLGMPACTLVEEQSSVGVALIDTLNIQGVVLRQNILSDFAKKASVHKEQIKYYQSIIGLREAIIPPPSDLRVFQEVHLIPSVIGFFQCDHLASQRDGQFHPSDQFVWDFRGEKNYVSDPSDAKLFEHFSIPRSVQINEIPCACGRTPTITLV